jgi:carboxyl-terminal processing protease
MLQAGDTILEVTEQGADPVDITNMRLSDAVRLLRGHKGTEVRLTVKKPDGIIEVIPIVRDVVQVEATFVKNTVLDAPDGGKIGYIMIPRFYRDFEKTNDGTDGRNATDDTRKVIEDFKKTKLEGIILDLRNDGGGSLIDAVDIANLFIKSGPVVQIKDSNGNIQVLKDENPAIEYSGPLVVLVNELSASASEIVAAALQDYKRAIIVGGEHTHGKGTVQAIINLNKNIHSSHSQEIDDVGALKVTIQKFYRITGESTQYKGVVPDIILPSLFQHLKSSEKYLENSLSWDQIGPVKYTPFSGKPIDLDMIRKRSLQRVHHDPGMQAIFKEAMMLNERSKQTAFSLKLADMRQQVEVAREERKKLSTQFPGFKTGLYDDEQSETDGKDVNKDGANWEKQIKQDPYVGEAKNIIVDM